MADRPKKFIKGHNPLKSKGGQKPLSKTKEIERKKAEEAETEAVLNEYIADFQTGSVQGKTFVRAGGDSQNKNEETKLYKPKSKMQELAEEFRKSKEITSEYKFSKDVKKKATEKKKSNLELFKEELEQSQKERDIRRKLRTGDLSGISEDVLKALPPTFFNAKSAEDEFGFQYEAAGGSHDTGDPTTTNLFISNINPKMNEEQLCKVFGRYGPLASVKIMWPRTDEEKLRNRNCGFVAFMTRKDGENALEDIEGKFVMDFEMKIGWGKAVPIPPQPIYIHQSQSRSLKPPKQSGLPFNCQQPYKQRKQNLPFDGNLENTVIKVVLPSERGVISVINRVVEFVVREGPMFEAMIMNRELRNPMYRFLFDNQSNEHVYYRWRVFSLLQGDTTQKWNQKCFRMFEGGSIWQPPSFNPFGVGSQVVSSLATSAALASASSGNMHNAANLPKLLADSDNSSSLAMKKNMLLQHLLKEDKEQEPQIEKEKKILSDRQRDRLEDMLRTITSDRVKVGELMMWCIDHAEYCEEIVECICESLSILETPFPTKIARLFVVSDILHNSSVKVRNASSYRKVLQDQLLDVMEYMHLSLESCKIKLQAEKFRKQVLSCLAAWQDWSLYPPAFLINLQNVFVGICLPTDIKPEESNTEQQKLALFEDTLDGEPLDLDDDIDGIPLAKTNTLEESNHQKNSPDLLKTEDPLTSSRWERPTEGVEPKVVSNNKWQKVEEVKAEDVKENISKNSCESPERKHPSNSKTFDDEDERKRLRDVELKVMRFVDKLEQRGGNKAGLNIHKEATKFRQQLLKETSRHTKRRKTKRDDTSSPEDDRRREKKRRSISPDAESHHKRGRSVSRSRSSSRGRSRSRSPLRRSPRYDDLSDSSRSPAMFSRRSPSPSSPKRHSKKKNKKSKR